MARSRLLDTSQDLITDGGSVLWSFVKGEQLEFPVVLNFIEDASVKQGNNYVYEAVVIEADNVEQQKTTPSTVKTAGVQTRLFVRLPVYLGAWQAAVAYNKEDVVLYNGVYYKLTTGAGRINATTPALDAAWTTTVLNKIYLQYPKTLAATWSVQPTVDSPVYGFFELRVTEPTDSIFTRTFKPVRGLVEVLFSPTEDVVDQPSQTTPL